MNLSIVRTLALLLPLAPTFAQAPKTTDDPFPDPINITEGVVTVKFVEFASIPDIPGQAQPARMMTLLNEPGTRRLFTNDMRGALYSISYDGKTVTKYVDIDDDKW